MASVNSKVFHRPDCKSVAKIAEKNLVRYNSREEAIQAGKKTVTSDRAMIDQDAIEYATGILREIWRTANNHAPTKKCIDAKDDVLKRYRLVFARDHIAKLTKVEFRDFLHKNRHWSGLARKGSRVCDNMPHLRKALSILLDDNRPLKDRLDILLPRSQATFATGLGKALVTAILHVTHPNRYAVWNGTSEAGMRAMWVWPAFPRGSTFGERYNHMNRIVGQLAKELQADLWTLDALWWLAKSKQIAAPTKRDAGLVALEGTSYRGEATFRRRNRALIEKKKKQSDGRCSVCQLKFTERYTGIGKDCLVAHHVEPIGKRNKATKTTLDDIDLLCPNCHAAVHTQDPPLTAAQLRKMLVDTPPPM